MTMYQVRGEFREEPFSAVIIKGRISSQPAAIAAEVSGRAAMGFLMPARQPAPPREPRAGDSDDVLQILMQLPDTVVDEVEPRPAWMEKREGTGSSGGVH